MELETKMRRFYLMRNEDETGISGTGIVAEGCVFWDGTCFLKWTTDTSSIGIYKSHVEMIHLHGHQGRTVIKWIDVKEENKTAAEPPSEPSNEEKESTGERTEKALEKVAEKLGEVSEKLDKQMDAPKRLAP